MKKLRIALIGQGRSGRNIHGAYLRREENIYYDVAAVVDQDESRRARALVEYPGCDVYADYRELFARNDIDVVLNSTYSNQHYSITKDLLMHKFNVLVEKPFAANSYECGDLIKTAKDNNVIVAVYQQSFYAPFYTKMKEVLASGILGEVMQISIRYNGFSRRWDWQTLQSRLAGSVYNTGPHPIGFALDLLDFSDETKVAFSKLGCALTSGDAEDFAKIILVAPGKPLVDLEINSIDAYSDWNFRIQCSKGTYQTSINAYKMKYIPDGANPERPVIFESLKNEKGDPVYCSEKLVTCEEEGTFAGTAFDVGTRMYYEMLYRTIAEGAPLEIKPEDIAKVITVIETVHGQNPLPVKY